MKKKRARRSAIVPRLLLTATVMSGAAVVPMLSGCSGLGFSVADIGFSVADLGFTVAAGGFDLSGDQTITFTVAAQGFDLANHDLTSED
jgi:hypothetical protein